ncbi:MAG: methionine--tRNA ligase [Firmicutes bacterium]|nr:methionine--tRNA ligase [Bacillota bacterium]
MKKTIEKSQKQAENKYYITTPLYYPSGKWHLGHSYTTVCCDAIARYKRLSGFDVFYLTGTDEHGQKIAERAALSGKTPKQFVDGLTDDIKRLWALLDISYDGFIRTTDDFHKNAVRNIFTRLYESGDIYKGKYKGKYCTPCEAFWTDAQLVDGKCPDCGREVREAEEDCYFFKLSKYQAQIEKLLTQTDFLQPPSRANEMVNNFVRPGLSDLAVSRASVTWGIPVPFDTKHVIYVWIDALSNYVTAMGYDGTQKAREQALGVGDGWTDGNKTKFWPADVHMVGKEIVRFHAIIWPAILMALSLPLPKKVYGHGWLLFGGDKMSKSKGNVADPFVLAERYGVDALRFYLLREIPFGLDGTYTEESFLTRINSDLVNDLGNLVKRSVAMANQYFGGVVKKDGGAGCQTDDVFLQRDNTLIEKIKGLKQRTDLAIDGLSCSKALEEIFTVIDAANKYIDQNEPWKLNKSGEKTRLNIVLYNLLESVRVIATLLLPFIRGGAERIFGMLNLPVPSDFSGEFGRVKAYKTNADEVLYPRLDVKKELEYLVAYAEKEAAGKEAEVTKAAQITQNEAKKDEKKGGKMTDKELIDIDQFSKIDLCIAEITFAEKVEKSDKLLRLVVRVGDDERVVVSGIAKHYAPEALIGKKAVLVANLQPVKIRGIESQGMLLAAGNGEKLVLISPEADIESGSNVN